MPDFMVSMANTLKNYPQWLKLLFFAFCAFVEYVLPFFPADTLLVVAGFLAASGLVLTVPTFLLIFLGSLIGIGLSYYFGRGLMNGQIKFISINKFVSMEKIDQFVLWYKKWGFWFLLGHRFLPGIRALFFMAAGFSELPQIKVFFLGSISVLFFNLFLFMIGFYLGKNTEHISWIFDSYLYLGYILFLLITSLIIIWLWIKNVKK